MHFWPLVGNHGVNVFVFLPQRDAVNEEIDSSRLSAYDNFYDSNNEKFPQLIEIKISLDYISIAIHSTNSNGRSSYANALTLQSKFVQMGVLEVKANQTA